MKQGTNLSHMANGRMPIPLDRAVEMASILPLDVTEFCLAVLEQRAPEVYETLEDRLGVEAMAALTPLGRSACHEIAAAPRVSDEHVAIISEALADVRPGERWLQPVEVPVIKMIREHFPQGVSMGDLELLKVAIDAVLDARP
jgi:hypothetical protein